MTLFLTAPHFDIDNIKSKLYWADGNNDEVGVANLDGSNRQTLYGPGICGTINAGGSDVVDIRIDASNE